MEHLKKKNHLATGDLNLRSWCQSTRILASIPSGIYAINIINKLRLQLVVLITSSFRC